MSARIPFEAAPMLATLVGQAFDRPGWVYEEKYDGDRVLAYKEGGRVRLRSRNDKDRTARFPQIVAALARLRATTLLLDGEVVVFDRHDVSRFQLLQEGRGEPRYAVFDCLYLNGRDLRPQPLSARRALLERTLGPGMQATLFASRRLAADGMAAYRLAKRRGYEGVVAKELQSAYVAGRSNKWLKVKVHQEDEFVVCGYTQPAGARRYFGALLLGAYDGDGRLRYVGKVGSGFDTETLAMLYRRFRPLLRVRSALTDPPRDKGQVFVAPKLVAQIAYQEWTRDSKLRQPVFLGLRDDKSAREVVLPVRKR